MATVTATAGRALPLALGGLIAMAAAVGIGRFIYTPILPEMVAALGLTVGDAGLIASANFAGYLAGALFAAMAGIRMPRRAALIGGLAVSALTTGAMALTDDFAAFLALRFIGGWASAFVLVFASTLVLERLAEAGRSGLSAVHFAGVGTGIAVSALVVAGLPLPEFSWRSHWIAAAAVSLLAALAVWRLVTPAPEPLAPPKAGAKRARGLMLLIGAYGLFGFGYVITATFIVAIVRGEPALAAIEPAVWLIVGLAAAPSVALWSWIAARLGTLPAYAAACVVEAAGVAASVAWTSPAGIVVTAILLGGTFMGLTALGLIAARRLATGDPRRTLAAMTASFGLGQIVGPVLAGLVHDATGSFVVPSLTAVGALLLAAGLVLLVRR